MIPAERLRIAGLFHNHGYMVPLAIIHTLSRRKIDVAPRGYKNGYHLCCGVGKTYYKLSGNSQEFCLLHNRFIAVFLFAAFVEISAYSGVHLSRDVFEPTTRYDAFLNA